MRVLTIYPNCSLGGMATVYKNRVRTAPNDEHWFVFSYNRGGLHDFELIEGANVRVIQPSRHRYYLKRALATMRFDKVSITSLPGHVDFIPPDFGGELVYEFHAPEDEVVSSELATLNLDRLSSIHVPTEYQRDVVHRHLPRNFWDIIKVEPNLMDREVFSANVPPLPGFDLGGAVPLVWVGRFDVRKNASDFLRLLALLPREYVGVVVSSYEHENERTVNFLNEAFALGVAERIRFLLNISHRQMAQIFRYAALEGGSCCSTALDESYGYTIVEALACGLPTVAYGTGALRHHRGDKLRLIDIGDLCGFARTVQELNAAARKH